MKKLTIQFNKDYPSNFNDFIYLETEYNLTLSQSFKEFILEYEDCSVLESVYYNSQTGLFYAVNKFLSIKEVEGKASMEAIFKGHLYYGDIGYVPFAIDPGGWDFNISIKPETYGQIWINRFDSGEEDPFEFVCESLEKFINSLMTSEEAVLLGY